MGFFDALTGAFDTSKSDALARQSLQAQKKLTNKGLDISTGQIGQGLKQAQKSYSQALAPFEDIYGQEQQGRQAYMNALGLNGPTGTQGARDMFTASPGYQYQLDQGNQSILRNQAAAGGLRSGQTAMDLGAYGQNLANQDWGNWLNRLQGFNPQSTAQAQAGILQNLGQTQYGAGTARAGITGNAFNDLSNQQGQYYGQLANNNNAASQNAWGAIGAGLGLGSKLLGMYG